VTVDPHLHRRTSLGEIYSAPALALHAAPFVSAWIARNVSKPALIGPDSEGEQWVSAVAADAGAPYVVTEKTRHGDRDVAVSVPHVERWRDHTPVLVDDIVSTAPTMIETVGHLLAGGMKAPVCIAIHGVLAGAAYDELRDAGAARSVTTNTIAIVVRAQRRFPSGELDILETWAESRLKPMSKLRSTPWATELMFGVGCCVPPQPRKTGPSRGLFSCWRGERVRFRAICKCHLVGLVPVTPRS